MTKKDLILTALEAGEMLTYVDLVRDARFGLPSLDYARRVICNYRNTQAVEEGINPVTRENYPERCVRTGVYTLYRIGYIILE